MRTYLTSKQKFINFFKSNIKNKFKTLLKLLGIKFITYNLIYFFLKFFFINKTNFIRGIIFDLQKFNSNLIGVSNQNEKFILFSNDKIISKEVFINGEFDLVKLKKTLKILEDLKIKIENLYDVGANIGVVCIPAVKQKLIKRCFAIEPENDNFKILKSNIILNDLEQKISTYNYAISNEDNKLLEMELSPTDSGDNRVRKDIFFNTHGEEKREIVKVETKTIDTLFPDLSGNKDLIWIDAQGHEPFILEGSKNAINKKVPIVAEFWPYGLKRSNSWDMMINIIKQFSYYVDLSSKQTQITKIDSIGIKDLKEGWQNEEKNKHSLFTDLLLLK